MVVALGPGRFYGNSLPRPFFYPEAGRNGDGSRVDPPVPVLDPLLSWACEAHWSMGGLSFKRRRLQGRIEGSIKRLRKQEETKERRIKKRKSLELVAMKKERSGRMQRLSKLKEEEEEVDFSEESDEEEDAKEAGLVLESEEEDADDGGDEDVGVAFVGPSPRPKRRVRNLVGEFDKMASGGWGSKTPSPVVKNKMKTSSSTRAERSERRRASSPASSFPVSVASPKSQVKVNNLVVTPRRSSRISPGKKKTGSV